MQLLRKDADFESFQRVMIEAHYWQSIRILSYCDLSNHWRFVVCTETDGQVTKKKGRAMRANAPRMGAGAT